MSLSLLRFSWFDTLSIAGISRQGKVTIALQPPSGYIVTRVFWYPFLQTLKPGIQYVGIRMSTLQQTPIEQLKLPGKLIRILHRNDIQTFGELQDVVNQGNLLRLRHVGKKIAGELTQLAAHISMQPDLYLATANKNNVNDGENTPQAQNKSEFLIQLDQVSVEKLELHPKIVHALTRACICTIGDLLLLQPWQLSRTSRIGSKAIRDIQIALDKALNSPENYIK